MLYVKHFWLDSYHRQASTMPTLDSSRFQFIAEALNGTGGFDPVVSTLGNTIQQQNLTAPRLETATYLIQYPRESKEKFARRNQVAWYRNFMHPACLRFAGYLAKKSPMRDLNNPLLEAFGNAKTIRNGIDFIISQQNGKNGYIGSSMCPITTCSTSGRRATCWSRVSRSTPPGSIRRSRRCCASTSHHPGGGAGGSRAAAGGG